MDATAFQIQGGGRFVSEFAVALSICSAVFALKMYFPSDSPRESAMAVVALKQKPAPVLKTFHATVLVTRAEEWCVEARNGGGGPRVFSFRLLVIAVNSATACT